MSRLVTLALLAISVSAQTDDLGRAGKNPYDLARYIASHTNVEWALLWKALRVADPPGRMPKCEPGGDWSCSIDLITVFQPTQVILTIQTWPEDVYLRFLPNGAGWRYAGIYVAFKKNFEGRHEITRITGRPFLRVSMQGASGSNVDGEYEQWLDLSRPGLEPVFSYTVQGDENRMGFGVSRWIHSSATPGSDSPAETIDVDLEVTYTMHYDNALGFAKYRATYERAPKQRRFSIREAHRVLGDGPEISNQDFDDLANIDPDNRAPSNERLLVYALPRLKEIASGSQTEAQDWLRSVLSQCKETPEKRMLLALLEVKR